MKSKPGKIDSTDLSIIKHLQNGRKSFSKIAKALAVTENTVRARVNRLVRDGVLDILGLVDPEAIPGHSLVMVGVKLNSMNLIRKELLTPRPGAEILESPGDVAKTEFLHTPDHRNDQAVLERYGDSYID